MTIATLAGPAGAATAACVHLGLVDRERPHHASAMLEALAREPEPIVVGGDLNEGPGGVAAARIAERYVDAWPGVGDGEGATYPASGARERIDALFVSEGVEVARVRVLDSPGTRAASDHLPLAADLSFGA
jgi:endonuclease/exonuclease/phosphatase family metal-dependent hydrolase